MMTMALQGTSSPPRVSSDPPGPCSPRGQASSTMACPLCQASFPLDQIEMHAATCYGEEEEVQEAGGGGGGGGHFYSTAADHFPASPRPKRARNRGLTAEETAAHSSSSVRNRGLTEEASHSSAARLFDKKEKCYICHKAVPSSEFGRHTEKCIRQQTSRSEQRGGGGGGGGGDLLSALEQTDSREPTEAGPSGVNYKEVIDLSGHEEEEEEEEEEGEEESEDVLCVSDSPIRAFTSVSEASGCLVDFKKQLHPRSPPRREAGKRGRGRGRRGGGRGGRGASRGRAVKRKYTR